jgi:hypothetical protein
MYKYQVCYTAIVPKIIILSLSGGLGNQIFLLKFASFVSSIDNRNIYILNHRNPHSPNNHEPSFKDFYITSDFRIFKHNNILLFLFLKLGQYTQKISDLFPKILLLLGLNQHGMTPGEIRELISTQNPLIVLITGFWQDFSFWDKSTYTLKKESKGFQHLYVELIERKPIIFHYRLGKIGNRFEHGWGALSPKYFLESVIEMDSIVSAKKAPIWIFSNDLEHAKTLLIDTKILNHQIYFVDDTLLSSAEIMILFSKAKYLICSNSTLSIAAAKLGSVENVIVPKFLSTRGSVTFKYPAGWRSVESDWLE